MAERKRGEGEVEEGKRGKNGVAEELPLLT